MTIKTRLSKLEKTARFSASFQAIRQLPEEIYERAFSTLAHALTDITGQETAPAEVENQLRKLTDDNPKN